MPSATPWTAGDVIPHARLAIGAAETEAVSRTLRTGMLAQGAEVRAFESAVAGYLGLPGGVAVSSGTAALHLAVLALGIGPGDEVIAPAFCCIAPVNAVRYTGADAVLADVDGETGNLTPDTVAAKLTPRTRAVILPHLLGHPADAAGIRALGVPVIEDLAQAIGAESGGQKAGSFGDIAICSFYATKVMTAGEGGMVLARDPDLLARARDLRDYDEKPDYRLRFNYKLTDFQAALGLVQLGRLPDFLARRRAIAACYDARFRGLSVRLPPRRPGCEPIFFRYVLGVEGGVEPFLARMAEEGVTCRRPIYQPLHRLVGGEALPETERLFARAVSIPLYPSLTDAEVARVAAAVGKVALAGG